MSEGNKIKIFLVDDDALFVRALQIEFLLNTDFEVETFATGEICILNLSKNPDVVILDYQLDSINKNAMNGIATLDRIKDFNRDIPVVILSSQDKIEVAVSCMQHMAFDYVVKTETAFIRLQKILASIFEYKKMQKELNWYMDKT